MTELLDRFPLRDLVTRGQQYGIWVDRPLARCKRVVRTVPRSTGGWDADGTPVHGTFATAAAALPRVAAMGFNVVTYRRSTRSARSHRKGRNNSVTAEPGDVGSPWAIGSAAGGHDAVHPIWAPGRLRRIRGRSPRPGLEVALDLALQPRTTRGRGSTATGSPNCPTGPSRTPRTRRRSTRTSIR